MGPDTFGDRSIEDRKARARRTKVFWRRKSGVGVLGNLLGCFEILVIREAIVELAVVGRVVAADLRARFVNSTTVIVLQMPTHGMHQQVPRIVINKDRCLFVKQVPSDIFEISKIIGSADRQRKIPAALGGAVVAKIFARRHIFTFEFILGESVHWPCREPKSDERSHSTTATRFITSYNFVSRSRFNIASPDAQVSIHGFSQLISYLLPCLSLLAPLVVCAMAIHWFERIIQNRLSTRFGWNSVLWTGWLGTPIHESSHVLMCPVFRHRVDEVAFFEPDRQSGRLGYVRHSFHQGNWFEEMGNLFIGVAPLIGGSLVLLTLLTLFYPDAANAAWTATSATDNHLSAPLEIDTGSVNDSSASPSRVWHQLWLRTSAMVSQLMNVDNWTQPRWWVFLYLVLCVGSHMAPSKSDYQGALKGSLITAAVFIAALVILTMLQVDAESFADGIAAVGAPLISVLALAMVLCGISTLLVVLLTSLIPARNRSAASRADRLNR